MKQFLKRLAFSAFALAAAGAVSSWVALTWVFVRPADYSPTIDIGPVALRSWAEHDAIYGLTKFPYVVSVQHERGALHYFGARHTSDASDPQLDELEKRWANFRPTIALCEGRSRMYRFAARPKQGSLNESELVRLLAYRDSVPVFTLEPTHQTEVAGLLSRFEPKLVATYLTLRVYHGEADRSRTNQDGLAQRLLRKRTKIDGLRRTISTIAELDAYWNQQFPGEPDWRTLSDTEGVPLLAEVGNLSRQVRGEHMVRALAGLVNDGERVFAVVGASHVIRQEPVLRRWLEASAAGKPVAD